MSHCSLLKHYSPFARTKTSSLSSFSFGLLVFWSPLSLASSATSSTRERALSFEILVFEHAFLLAFSALLGGARKRSSRIACVLVILLRHCHASHLCSNRSCLCHSFLLTSSATNSVRKRPPYPLLLLLQAALANGRPAPSSIVCSNLYYPCGAVLLSRVLS